MKAQSFFIIFYSFNFQYFTHILLIDLIFFKKNQIKKQRISAGFLSLRPVRVILPAPVEPPQGRNAARIRRLSGVL